MTTDRPLRRQLRTGTLLVSLCVTLTSACGTSRDPGNPEPLAPQPVVLETDAGWCWFQDERALVLDDHRVIFGSVASGWSDPSRAGSIQVTQWDTRTDTATTVPLRERFEKDDHDAPVFWPLANGQVLATYCGHGKDDLMRWRITARDDDATAWLPEQSLQVEMHDGRGVTYANVIAGGRLCFCRADGWDPTVLARAADGGWSGKAGMLLSGPGRPYLKYTGDGHFIATEQHPRDFDNSLYYGVYDRATEGIHRADRTEVGTLAKPPAPEQLTRIFQGRPDAVAWPCDLELDAAGRPVCAFSVQVDGAGLPRGKGGMDHRYWLARWSGTEWRSAEIAHAGTRLYAGEDDYTGLCAIVPDDTDTVFISTNAHPMTGAPLVSERDGKRHWEIWRGVSAPDGLEFARIAITANSTEDNLRPIVPRWREDRCVLLWLRGEYRSYTDYRQAAVGVVLDLRR